VSLTVITGPPTPISVSLTVIAGLPTPISVADFKLR